MGYGRLTNVVHQMDSDASITADKLYYNQSSGTYTQSPSNLIYNGSTYLSNDWCGKITFDKTFIDEIVKALNKERNYLENIEDIEIPPLRGFIEI